MKTENLKPFVLVYKDEIISPELVTTRNYGEWFESYFDSYTTQLELYMRSRKKDGTSVLEFHPGTRIGQFYNEQIFDKPELQCWFLESDSSMVDRLCKLQLAKLGDSINVSVDAITSKRMLRVYTLPQIELYIKTQVDKSFTLCDKYDTARQIKLRETDLGKFIRPDVTNKRKSLF